MLITGFLEFIAYWSIFVFYATKSKNKLGEEENLLVLCFHLSNFVTVICSNVSTSDEISQVLTLFWYQDCLYRVCNGREVLHSFWACQTGFLWQKPFFLSFNVNVYREQFKLLPVFAQHAWICPEPLYLETTGFRYSVLFAAHRRKHQLYFSHLFALPFLHVSLLGHWKPQCEILLCRVTFQWVLH